MSACPPDWIKVQEIDDDGYSVDRFIDNRMAVLEWSLRSRHVSPEIVARVLRLNTPDVVNSGRMLRGIHYKPGRGFGFMRGAISKGEILRKYGREVWAAIPREAWHRDGRRIWVSHQYLAMAVRSVGG